MCKLYQYTYTIFDHVDPKRQCSKCIQVESQLHNTCTCRDAQFAHFTAEHFRQVGFLFFFTVENVLDEIPDSPHKTFMNQYLKDWPFPHLTQYRVGQTLNAELNGVQQRCEVQVVDSSLIQVVFQDNQQKEWIHRGSIRLEHMARFLEKKEAEQHDDDSD